MDLYAVPPALLLILAIVLAPLVACGGQWLVHRRFDLQAFFVNNDVAGFMIAVVGTLYAVVLGFMTVQVWEHYEAARVKVYVESASVADVWHDAVGMPAPVRARLRADMLAYARSMRDDEWPAMRHASLSRRGDELIMDATVANGQHQPKSLAESNAQAALITQLNLLHDARANRLAANAESVSSFQWAILWIGAAVVLAFCYVFRGEHLSALLVMTGSVAVLIVTMFVLLFELQYPFRSQLGVSDAAWTSLIAHIEWMDRMANPMSM